MITVKESMLHALIVAVPFVVLALLTVRWLAPSGTFTVAAGTLERSPYINRLLPVERAPESSDGAWVRVVEDPTYFTVNVPDGGYNDVTVTLEFANHGQPVIELGALTDMFAQAYDLRPLQNTIIDALDDWERTVVDGATRYSREPGTQPTDMSTVATYRTTFAEPYRDAAYAPLGTTQTLGASLRGYHKYATYIRDETFAVTLGYMDMNRTAGADAGVVRVWNENGDVMLEQHFADDGNAGDNQLETHASALTLAGSGWPEGVYTVELSGTSDIFWRSIATPQRYVTFVNRLYVGDDVAYLPEPRATRFVTSAKHLVFETFHADSPEHVVIGDKTVALLSAGDKTRATITAPGTVAGYTPVGDVKMTGDGLFALTEGSFFNPYPVQLNAYTDLAAQGIAYVVTTYAPAEHLADGWYRASATFDLAPTVQSDGTVKFTLSTPGITEWGASVEVRNVTLAFHKSPMTFAEILQSIIRRVVTW